MSGMSLSDLENLSVMTIMAVCPSDNERSVKKSIAMCGQG